MSAKVKCLSVGPGEGWTPVSVDGTFLITDPEIHGQKFTDSGRTRFIFQGLKSRQEFKKDFSEKNVFMLHSFLMREGWSREKSCPQK